jgi:hypothetical protein
MKCLVFILLVAVGHARLLVHSLGIHQIDESEGVQNQNKTREEVGHVKALLAQVESEESKTEARSTVSKRTAGGKRMAPDKGSKVDPRIRDAAQRKKPKCEKKEQGCDRGE